MPPAWNNDLASNIIKAPLRIGEALVIAGQVHPAVYPVLLKISPANNRLKGYKFILILFETEPIEQNHSIFNHDLEPIGPFGQLNVA